MVTVYESNRETPSTISWESAKWPVDSETLQMRQVATFRGDYLYPIAHLCIISRGRNVVYKFCGLNILRRK